MEDTKKVERKRKRFTARLKSSKGIVCVETAGPYIILCNAGQATGFEKHRIINLINEYCLTVKPPKIVIEKGMTYCYLLFQNTEDAVTFFNVCNGKGKADELGTPIYMNYVEKVPNTEVICPHEVPKGVSILPNFISTEEEQLFIKLFDWTSEDSSLKNRQVKHYGYEFRYGTNDVDLDNPLSENIPDACDVLWKRMVEHGFNLGRPDQLTVNKYSPGQGIPSHVDRHSPFGGTILSLSLGSAVVMEWRHRSGAFVPTLLPSRSMLVMQDEARYDWQHGIQPRSSDPRLERRAEGQRNVTVMHTHDTAPRQTRISLTFRWTRSGPCECGFEALCDTAGTASLDDSIAAQIEELHVHQVYEQIAGHFSHTRHKVWPRVEQFVRDVPPGTVLLDLGAGNGKNVLRRNDILQIAGERSGGLLRECVAHTRAIARAACVRLDVRHAALRDACADVVICIAVVHHMTTQSRRLQAIATIHRLLRRSGKALITVWAKDQTRSNYLSKNKAASENLQLNVNGVNLHVHENRTQFQHEDVLVPWKLRNKCGNKMVDADSTLLRFYHVFEDGELNSLCREVGFEVESSFYEEGNWCVICTKV